MLPRTETRAARSKVGFGAPYDFNRNWGVRCDLNVTLAGHRAIVLENEILRITVLVDKGTDIVEFLHKPSDTDFMWRAPRDRHTAGYALANAPAPEGDFHDHYLGGWHELLPSFDGSGAHGANHGLCGEATLLPWHCTVERDDREEVCLRFDVRIRRLPLRVVKRLRLQTNSPTLFTEETVSNEGGQEVAFDWGHHPVIGPAFLRPECVIEAPGRTIVSGGPGGADGAFTRGACGEWPILDDTRGNPVDVSRVAPPAPGWEEDLYLPDVPAGWVGLTDRGEELGFGLAWQPEVFSHLWLWQNLGGRLDYPWYGRTYCLGLEFLSGPFDDDSRARLRLDPGGELKARHCATVYRPGRGLTGIDPLTGEATFADPPASRSPAER